MPRPAAKKATGAKATDAKAPRPLLDRLRGR
ncbi:hypothetical protein DER30_6673 [Streptomyces sp. HB202]|nr:hypothetical protein DER30_6673 [Streptomyces sp. HB202]